MKRKGITIKFGNDRRSQAAATHFLDAMMGNKPSPTCATCGGITNETGPAAGRCDCKPPAAVATDTPALHEENARQEEIRETW